MKVTQQRLRRIISEEIQNVRRESYMAQRVKAVNTVCDLLRENRDNPNTAVVKDVLRRASLNLEMSKYLRSSVVENLTADVSGVEGVTDVSVNDSLTDAGSQELPAELSDIEDNEERSTAYHLWTLLQAWFPPAAIVRIIQSLLAGDWKGVIKNFPGINVWQTPEAMWELLEKGLKTMPVEMREDILSNKAVNLLMKLMFSLKEVTTASDISEFYSAVKGLVASSWPATVALIGLLSAISGLCAWGTGTGMAAGGPVLVLASVLGGLAFSTGPLGILFFGAGLALATFCIWAAGSAAALASISTIIVMVDPGAKKDAQMAYANEVQDLLTNMENTHKQQAEELAKVTKEDKTVIQEPVDVEEDDVDTVSLHAPGEWSQSGPVQPMSEGLSYDRLQILCGLDK